MNLDEALIDSEAYPVMRRRKAFTCPHCGELCSLPVSIQILEPEKFVDNVERDETPYDPYRGLSADQKAIAEAAERSGMLAAFAQAVARRSGASEMNPHRTLPKFFVTFLRMARPKRVPEFVLKHYVKAFGGRIDFWGSQGVLAVVADGKIRAFLPLNMAIGVSVKSATASRSNIGRLAADESEFFNWVKTRNGYVPASCQLFLKEMQKRSIGDFAEVRL